MHCRLFDDRLSQFNEELALLNQPICQHPEYIAMMESIDQRRDEKIEYEQMLLKYKLEALVRRSVGERAIQHSQYMQCVRDVRDDVLEQIGKEWYQIQRGRRSYDEDNLKYIYKFPIRRSQQITQQSAYNTEVSILSGMARYVGFPAAPELTGARPEEIDDDFKRMGVSPARHRFPRNPDSDPCRLRRTLSIDFPCSLSESTHQYRYLQGQNLQLRNNF